MRKPRGERLLIPLAAWAGEPLGDENNGSRVSRARLRRAEAVRAAVAYAAKGMKNEVVWDVKIPA